MKYTYIAALAVGISMACSCTSSEDRLGELFESQLYINTDKVANDILFKPVKGEITEVRELTVGVPAPATDKIEGTFVYDGALLDRYNTVYGEEAVLFPEEQVEIANGQVSIEVGSVKSSASVISFSGIEKLSRKLLYVAPVRLTDVSGIDLLDSKSIVYYVFRGAALINVVPDVRKQYFPIKWASSEVKNMPVMTFEALVNIEKFGNTDVKQHQSNYVFGHESHFLIRISDLGMSPDVINIVNEESHVIRGSLHIPENQWAHIAVVWDSVNKVCEFYVNGQKDPNTGSAYGALNFSSGSTLIPIDTSEPARFLNGMMSEVRVWNVRRTPEEMVDYMYNVDPKTPGLIAYWKMDEGSGTEIKDYTGHGNTMKCKSDYLRWVPVSLPEEPEGDESETPEE